MEHNKVCCILEVDVVLWIPEERSTSWCVSKTPYFTSTKIMLGTCVVRQVRTSICTYLRKETKSGRNESWNRHCHVHSWLIFLPLTNMAFQPKRLPKPSPLLLPLELWPESSICPEEVCLSPPSWFPLFEFLPLWASSSLDLLPAVLVVFWFWEFMDWWVSDVLPPLGVGDDCALDERDDASETFKPPLVDFWDAFDVI